MADEIVRGMMADEIVKGMMADEIVKGMMIIFSRRESFDP